MFLVRIDKHGWDKYTGLLGAVEFKDGISQRPLTPQEVARLGAVIRLVRVDDDSQVGAGSNMANIGHISAEVKAPLSKPTPVVVEVKEKLYTRAALEEIASTGGIKAIREVANGFNVKGVQISNMIEGILQAQGEE